MAVVRMNRRGTVESPTAVEELVAELADELKRDTGIDQPVRQPIVIEDETSVSSLHVAVIWDKWRLIEAGRRSRVILEAYSRSEGHKVDRISIALPATTVEALSLGLLPYAIRPVPYSTVSDPKEILAAIHSEGAIETLDGPAVLLPNREAADAAIQRLAAKTQLHDWLLERSVRAGVDQPASDPA